MAERTKRRGPWLKLLMASGVLGAGGTGAYQYADLLPSFAQPTTQQATLDAAQEAWAETPAANPLGSLPMPQPVSQPSTGGSRYAASPLPFAVEESTPLDSTNGQPIARGQNPSDEYDSLPTQPINPLRSSPASRYNDQPTQAQHAFEQQDEISPPPAALAAFNDSTEQPRHSLVQAIEPLADEPPAPMGMPPMPTDDIPLAALPQAPAADAPAAFGGNSDVAPLPMDQPNPLRSVPEPPRQLNEQPPVPQPNTEEPVEPLAPMPAPAPNFNQPPAAMPPAPAPSTAMRSLVATPPAAIEPSFDSQPQEPLAMTPAAQGAGRPGERALEGRQQPTLAIQKFAPAEVQVGKPCKFLVKVRNTGQRPAMDVTVNDQIPAGTQLVATKPQAQSNGDAIRWSIGVLAPGEERTLEMELTPTEEGQIGSVATVSFQAEASVQTTCTRPQLALRMTAPSKVLVGQQQLIQIEIKNPGTGDATGVVIFENVPENLRHAAGPTLEFEIGTLRPGETRKLQLNMQAESAGKVINTLTAQADGNLHVDQQVEFEVVAPGLQVALDGPKRRYLERPADYTVKVGNPGTASARNLRLVTQLPRGMKFVKANNLGEYDASTHAVYWSLAELPAGESGAVQLTAMPVSAGDHKIEVRAESADGLRDQAILGTQVEGIAAIKFSVTDMEDPIEVGGETEYLVRVANQGTKAATNVAVQVAAPAGVRVVSATGDTRHRVEGGLVVFEPIRQLAPGSEVSFRLRVQGVQQGDHRLVVEVGSDDLAQPVRKEESTRVFGDE